MSTTRSNFAPWSETSVRRHGLVPLLALRRERTAAQVVDRGVVHGHHAGARATLDRHVAHRHAAFHRERADGGTAELDRVARAARGPDLPDDRENQILGGDAGGQRSLASHQHGLHLLLHQALRRHHVLDLGGADAVRQGRERAVGAGVRIPADHRHAGKHGALLRRDHVHDPLALVLHPEIGLDLELLDVAVEGVHLQARDGVGDRAIVAARRRGDVVVGGGDDRSDAPWRAVRHFQALEGLGAGHLMDDVPVDVQQRGAVGFLVDDV